MPSTSPLSDTPTRSPFLRVGSPGAGWLDAAGITVSVVCAIHCAAGTVVLAALTLLGVSRALPDWLEWAFLITSLIIGSVALLRGYRTHRQPLALRLFGLGIGALLLARLSRLSSPWEIAVVVFGATSVVAAHALNWRFARSCTPCAFGAEAPSSS